MAEWSWEGFDARERERQRSPHRPAPAPRPQPSPRAEPALERVGSSSVAGDVVMGAVLFGPVILATAAAIYGMKLYYDAVLR